MCWLWRMAPPVPGPSTEACPLLMTSLMTRVYTDEPHRCRAAKAALELVPQDLENCNDYRGHCLHCRQEITAQGGVEWRPDSPEALPALRGAKDGRKGQRTSHRG